MKDSEEKIQRKDVYFVPISKIKIIEGFNKRFDYGDDMDELTENIRVNGIKVPMHGYKERGTEFYVIYSGHRRLMAGQTILKKHGIDLNAPFIIDKETSMEVQYFNMLLYNEGKKFNPLEEAEVINQLLNYHFTESEISKRTGKSLVYISSLKTLYSAPQKLKNLVKDGIITATLAIDILRKNKGDGEKAFEEINVVVQQKNSSSASSEQVIPELFSKEDHTPSVKKNPVKVVKKDIAKSQNRTNSILAFKKLDKIVRKHDYPINEEKKDLYEFLVDFINGKYTHDQLQEYFIGTSGEKEK